MFPNPDFIGSGCSRIHLWPESWIDRGQGYSGGIPTKWETNQPPGARREESQSIFLHKHTHPK